MTTASGTPSNEMQMTADDIKFQTQSDMRVLADYNEIMKDPKRMARITKQIDGMENVLQFKMPKGVTPD